MQNEKLFMRGMVVILLVCVLGLVWRLSGEQQRGAEQRTQISDLTLRLNDKGMRERIEYQEKCALQAEKTFRAMGYRFEADSLQSHFHPASGHCFMLMVPFPKADSGGNVGGFKFLMDAYEQKSLATYGWRSQTGKQYSEVPPLMCELVPPSGSKTVCKSEKEFDQFVTQYME